MPIEIGPVDRMVAVWQALLEAGIYVNLMLPPACRAYARLLRTSYSAAHTDADIDRALAVFETVGLRLAVIEAAA